MGKFDGEYKAFYQNGNLKCSIFFKEGQRQGRAQWFDENGNRKTKLEYDVSENIINSKKF